MVLAILPCSFATSTFTNVSTNRAEHWAGALCWDNTACGGHCVWGRTLGGTVEGDCVWDFPIPEVLSSGYLIKEFRPDLIEMLMNQLVPDRIRIAVISQSFQGKTTHQERWYGTEYKITEIPEDTLQRWRNAGFNDKFTLPPRNEFIPTKFEITPREEETAPFPVLIKDTSMTKLWFKQDDTFLLPKACMLFEFTSCESNKTPQFLALDEALTNSSPIAILDKGH
ncbi:insulin-degrading enzyme-like [Saccoglossus kowalevskii]